MGKPFESPHADKNLRFMDWLDWVEERYGHKEVGGSEIARRTCNFGS